MDPAELRRRVEAIRWYHTLDLGHGLVTKGHNDPAEGIPRLGLPASLAGRTVLDVGAWDGAYSFEAERRGAARVLATDGFSWGGGGWGTKEGFELARSALGSTVDDLTIDVFDLAPDTVGGTFDLVLFLGVLYHVKDPIGAIERVASVTADGGQLILETEVDLMLLRRPAAALYPTTELKDDPTNWWGLNPAAVCSLLKAVGFARVEVAWAPSLARRVGGLVRHRRRDALQRNRAVFHAWKAA